MIADLEHPRLVPVDPGPVTLEDGSRAIALRDPLRIVEHAVALSPAAWWLAAHFDGRHAIDAIVAEARAKGLEVDRDDVAALAAQLRDAGFVHGPTWERLHARALAAFRALRVRPPTCAGGVYPTRPEPLRRALDGWLAQVRPSTSPVLSVGPEARSRRTRDERKLGQVRLPKSAHPERSARAAGAKSRDATLLVTPHIDYHRGGVGYAHAYAAVRGLAPELVVVFGTAHATPARLFTLTRLDYDTPLGPVPTDRAVVDAIAAALGEDAVLGDELAHRDEHSCELQLPWLRHVLGGAFAVLPVLCSSISHLDDPAAATAPFLDALARAVAGRRVLWVAAADLAHVGPQYGDASPPGPHGLRKLAAEDLATLAFVERGDPEGFRRDAVRDDARRRLCGTAPIYAALRAAGVGARLLHHGQWSDGTDSVSYAAAVG